MSHSAGKLCGLLITIRNQVWKLQYKLPGTELPVQTGVSRERKKERGELIRPERSYSQFISLNPHKQFICSWWKQGGKAVQRHRWKCHGVLWSKGFLGLLWRCTWCWTGVRGPMRTIYTSQSPLSPFRSSLFTFTLTAHFVLFTIFM